MTSKLQTHTVTDDEADIRLDRWFKRHFPAVTHGQLQKILRKGEVRVDGKRAETSTRLAAGQSIRVPPQIIAPPKALIEKQSTRVASQLKKMILFEDDDVIVLNKPAGLAVQGGTGIKENIDDMLQSLNHPKHGKPKLVHRLDRDTSGVLLLARTAFAATKLTASFRHRDTQKIYWALVAGTPKPENGRVDAPLLKQGEIMVVEQEDREDAKSAITLYQTIESAKKLATFVALWPITGRTHQLRVHMSYLGMPILGDRLYGGEVSLGAPEGELGTGLHLHARRLIIPHPRRGVIDVSAPLGPEMRKTWKWFCFDENAASDFEDQ